MTDLVKDNNNLEAEPLTEQIIQNIVNRVVKLHFAEQGASVDRNATSVSGQKLFAVAIFSERKFATQERELREDIVKLLVNANRKLLQDSLCIVGSWYSDELNESILEMSVVVANRELAIKLGKEYNQISIFDLHGKEEIKLGGNGILPNELESLSETERLDRLRSEIKKSEERNK